MNKQDCIEKYSMKKEFFICDCLASNIKTVNALRLFGELMFEKAGYIINEFAMSFETKTGRIYDSFDYNETKKDSFDDYPIDELSAAMFDFLPKGGNALFEMECSLRIRKNKTGEFSITCVFLPHDEKTYSLLNIEILKFLNKYFIIRYFCMDSMATFKRPEMFVLGGVCEDVRDEIEDTAAHSVQLSVLIHHKLPFLFQYNFFYSEQQINFLESKRVASESNYYYELYYPENAQKEFAEYYDNPEWSETFKALTDLGVLKLGN